MRSRSCQRAKNLRNARLAHLSLGEILKGSTPLVVAKELEQLADELEKLYQPLLFGASASFLPIPYDPEIRAANSPQAPTSKRYSTLSRVKVTRSTSPRKMPESGSINVAA
jgi:hypothetical protein